MVTVTHNGTTIDDLVLAERIAVQVGRSQVLDQGEPGSASLTLWLGQWRDVRVRDRIVVADDGSVRFDGRVSDVPRTWWEDDPQTGAQCLVMSLQCVGPMAAWGRSIVGDEPWPAETIALRAARIAALAGDPLVVQGGLTLRVVARDVDAQTAFDVLSDLASDASGWLYDHAGTTYLQSLEIRRIGDRQEKWRDQTTTWDGMAGTWEEQTEATGPRSLHPPADAVLWAPSWEMTSQIANHVRVTYGPEDPETGEQLEVVREDPASIAEHDRHDVTIVTRLEVQADAEQRGDLTLERAAQPQWHMSTVELAWELLDAETAAALDAMVPGVRCDLDHLPMPGPSAAFTGIVEGWTERWEQDTDTDTILRTFALHLSDVRWSFAVLTWAGIVPDTLPWASVTSVWDDLLTVDDLTEVAA